MAQPVVVVHQRSGVLGSAWKLLGQSLQNNRCLAHRYLRLVQLSQSKVKKTRALVSLTNLPFQALIGAIRLGKSLVEIQPLLQLIAVDSLQLLQPERQLALLLLLRNLLLGGFDVALVEGL